MPYDAREMTASSTPHDASFPRFSAAQIRREFIDFFVAKRSHRFVPSSPVVPHDDPTLLFANAGMNQFKPYFLGTERPEHPRAVNTQKCIRAGGKHNDLDDVGKDSYHHTFFEMLGNWSFGDYFKNEAIAWAWELLVDVWGLDPGRLHATYFEGDPAEGLEPDLEAKALWEALLPTDQVHPGNKKDNFWEMGDTGPCGPCSELHYDRSPDCSGAGLVNADDQDTVIEIWNLVFIQYNRGADGKLSPLPAKHVDTGMGFERIVRVLQDKTSNYDTDVFTPLFAAISDMTAARPYDGGEGTLDDPIDTAYRVIADHIRTLTFALTDGAHCGNEGRDYVLRRILRRAVKYGRVDLGVEGPFFHKLVKAVVETFGDAFPELTKDPQRVAAEIESEEQSFGKTLDRGLALFEQVVSEDDDDEPLQVIPADTAFTLHDTYGFPIDLTELLARERGLDVDTAGFEALMEQARERSRGGGDTTRDATATLTELVSKGLDAQWFEPTNFTGHEATETPLQTNPLHVFALRDGQYVSATQAEAGEEVAVVLHMTPFYGEAGGQVGDTGTIQTAGASPGVGGGRVRVSNCLKIGGVHLHLGKVTAGPLVTDPTARVATAVDPDRRAAIVANHTATHLMNRALRDHVNQNTAQKGSLVNDQHLRFDFSHDAALTPEQIEAVEQQVNADIDADLIVDAQVAPQQDALQIHSLRAVFGEKYPPRVRVVSIGQPVKTLLHDPDNTEWSGYSIEFCGGTHLSRTGLARRFALVSQDAVSRGVRRVTGVTGDAAEQAERDGRKLMERVEGYTSSDPVTIAKHIDDLMQAVADATLPLRMRTLLREQLAELAEQVKQHRKAQGSESEQAVVDAARAVADAHDGSAILVAPIDGADAKTLRTAMDVLRKRHPQTALLLAAVEPESSKVALLAAVPDAMIKQGLKAGDWVKHTAAVVGGGGGGRPDMAQAGGKDPAKLPEALDAARAFAAEKL